MTQTDCLADLAPADAFIIAAGKTRAVWFDGAGFSLYRARAKVYPNRAAAIEAAKLIRKNYARPNIRVVPFSASVQA